MTEYQKFSFFLREEGVKNFKAREVLTLGPRSYMRRFNSLPGELLWHNILPVIRFIDSVAEDAGRIKITEAFRNKKYNRLRCGIPESLHCSFRACHVAPLDMDIDNLWRICVDKRRKVNFLGGLGRHPGFIHVDCRGSKATWISGRSEP